MGVSTSSVWSSADQGVDRNLVAYQRAKVLVIEVYKLLKLFPREENYALCDQLRRAVISIPSNIAEGMGRVSIKEQIHFIEIAFGSLSEVMCQMELAKDLNYITVNQIMEVENLVRDIAKLLSGLRTKRLNITNKTNGMKSDGGGSLIEQPCNL